MLTIRHAPRFRNDCPPSPSTDWPGCHVQNLHYAYDPVGNITNIRDDAQQIIYFRRRRVEPSSEYTYDALYRLIAATGREHLGQTDGHANPPVAPEGANGFHNNLDHPHDGRAMGTYLERYSYDQVGNILEMRHHGSDPAHPGWRRAYQYASDSNRLTATDTDHLPRSVRYVYDTHGSMLKLANVAPGQFLRWDYRDMIRSLDLVGGGWAYYNYDSGKQRTRKRLERLGGTVEEWLYLGGMEVYRRLNAEEEVVEEIETHHLFVDEQRVLLVEDVLVSGRDDLPAGVLYRYQYGNHLGSVAVELDAAANVISYEEFHPYGTTAYQGVNREVRAAAKRYRYAGMERDEESGLNYHAARYYASWLARWVSTDPTDIGDGLNLSAYARNSPIVSSDVNGKDTYHCEYQPPHHDVSDDPFGVPDVEIPVRERRIEQGVLGLAPTESRIEAFALLAADAYTDQRESASADIPEGYERLSDWQIRALGLDPALFNSTSGMSAALYRHALSGGAYGYVLAFRGTEGPNMPDIISDILQGGVGGITGTLLERQYRDAMTLSTRIAERLGPLSGNHLVFLGHSLGGGLASAASVATGYSAITFNAAGLNAATIANFYNPYLFPSASYAPQVLREYMPDIAELADLAEAQRQVMLADARQRMDRASSQITAIYVANDPLSNFQDSSVIAGVSVAIAGISAPCALGQRHRLPNPHEMNPDEPHFMSTVLRLIREQRPRILRGD